MATIRGQLLFEDTRYMYDALMYTYMHAQLCTLHCLCYNTCKYYVYEVKENGKIIEKESKQLEIEPICRLYRQADAPTTELLEPHDSGAEDKLPAYIYYFYYT